MGYMTDGLTFNALRAANMARLPEFRNRHGEPAHGEPDGSDWSPAQWLQAVLGELGEYANVRKKFERGDLTLEEFYAAAATRNTSVLGASSKCAKPSSPISSRKQNGSGQS